MSIKQNLSIAVEPSKPEYEPSRVDPETVPSKQPTPDLPDVGDPPHITPPLRDPPPSSPEPSTPQHPPIKFCSFESQPDRKNTNLGWHSLL